MKKTTKAKFILIILFFSLSIAMIYNYSFADSNTSGSLSWNKNEDNNGEMTLDELREINYYDFIKEFDFATATDIEETYYREATTWYNRNITKEELEEIKNKKNDEFEITISDKELTKNELLEKFLPTVVSIRMGCVVEVESGDNRCVMTFGGNIYDITDEAIYIITCSHALKTDWEYSSQKLVEVTYFELMFIDGTKIRVEPDCFSYSTYDLGLIKIDRNLLEQGTLDVIKSINIDNIFVRPLEGLTSYTVRYSDDAVSYTVYEYTCEKTNNIGDTKILSGNGTLVQGCSGMGLFDLYGNYNGYCKNGHLICYFSIFPDFYDLLLESGY